MSLSLMLGLGFARLSSDAEIMFSSHTGRVVLITKTEIQ